MSLTINIEGDMRAILADLERVQNRHVPLATVRALNRTLAWMRTKAKREIASEVGVPIALANRWMRQRKGTLSNRAIMVGLLLRPIPAVRLPHPPALIPVFVHLAIVLLLGLWIPPYLAEWYRQAAQLIG